MSESQSSKPGLGEVSRALDEGNEEAKLCFFRPVGIYDIDVLCSGLPHTPIECRNLIFKSEPKLERDCLDQLLRLGRINNLRFSVEDPLYIFGEQHRPKLAKLLSQVVQFRPDCVWDNLLGLLRWFDNEGYSFDNISHLQINNLQMLHVDMWDLLWEAFPHVQTISYYDYTQGIPKNRTLSVVSSDNDAIFYASDQYGIETSPEMFYTDGDVEWGCRSIDNNYSDELCGHPQHEGRYKHACKDCNEVIQLVKKTEKENTEKRKEIDELKDQIERTFGALGVI